MLASRQRHAETAELADRVIAPDVQSVGLLDFRRLDPAVAAGQRAVDDAAEAGG